VTDRREHRNRERNHDADCNRNADHDRDASADRWIEARAKAMAGSIEDWATESLLAAQGAYVMSETGALIKPGRKLGDEYQADNLPVVKQRLYQAGVRLAMMLNEVWPEE
jgi:hypothetical protein